MNYSIIWSPRSLRTFEHRLQYLKIHWTEKEITNFNNRVKEYLETLKEKPFIGKIPGEYKNVTLGLLLNKYPSSIG